MNEKSKNENSYLINPKDCVKVISTSAIYYPPKGSDEQALSLLNSMLYLQTNFQETITTFSAGDQVVVVQIYNGILFYIQSHRNISEGLLRFLLQIIRDIAAFLFGARFDTFMSKNIIEAYQTTYENYVEKFFELCNNDYKYLLLVPDIDVEHSNLGKFLKERNPLNQLPIDPSFVECVLFYNHKIIGRYKSKQSPFKFLDQKDLFQLALNERVEFSSATFSASKISEEFLKENIKYKRGNLSLNSSIQTCVLCQAQLGKDSPFVITLAFKSEKSLSEEIVEQIFQVIKGFISAIKSFESDPIVPTSFQVTGLLHYLLINRTTGQYYEMLKPNVSYPIFNKIQRKMASVALTALQNGNFALFRNQMKFQYTYELKFRKKGNIIIPTEKLNIQPGEISYQSIVHDLFPNDNTIQCFEFMTVYLGVMNTKVVIDANKQLFETILSSQS